MDAGGLVVSGVFVYRDNMGTIKITDGANAIRSDEDMLALWRQVEIDLAETGQSYNSPGGMMVQLADLARVERMVAKYERRCYLKRGYAGRNYADLTGSDDSRETL